MIREWEPAGQPEEEEVKERLQTAEEKLEMYQLLMKEHRLPVLVLVEGWGAAGKGSVISRVIRDMDPRFFRVAAMGERTQEERRKPFLHRYAVRVPQEGKFEFLDGGWLDETVRDRFYGDLAERDWDRRMESIRRFERQLADNGYLVLKFFFQISAREQRKRLKVLDEDKDTRWRVSRWDRDQNENYEACGELYARALEETDVPWAPWHVVDARDRRWAALQVMEVLCSRLESAFREEREPAPVRPCPFPLVERPLLSQVDLSARISEEEYKEERRRLQARLGELHNRLYRKKVPVIIVYEGWDAAGKGGNIKRLAGALDPRGYEVIPIASPEPYEKARHYLWRFWTRLPKTGHIAIFDRSWYGRVMVERLEGFCTEDDWRRAYNEINEFERELCDWGAVVVKFWVQIDKDTQLARFRDRERAPEKRWKITDEDWRNREKWDQYEAAVDEMIRKTSTECAPWYILPSVDKKYARIQAMKIVIQRLEEVLFDRAE